MTDLPEVEKGEEKLTHQDYAYAAEHGHHGSFWPILLAFGVGLMPFGVLLYVWVGKFGLFFVGLGGLVTLYCLGGWLNVLIREKTSLAEVISRVSWQRNAVKLFLISEAAIFGALFTHHFYARAHLPVWPPAGAPHLDTTIPFIATLILVASSFTMEHAHKLLLKGKMIASQSWVLLTIILGAIFLSCQGYEWGFLKAYDEFTLKSGTFGTSFYMMTGFHGLHVSMGLIVLMLTFVRLRLGHFTPQNHFFLVGSSWYWHFVDIVWVFLFGTMYLL
jgi:cytochrome c oxidase subunit 3